jgi:hypothetical protein
MDAKVVRLKSGAYAIEVDGEEVGAIVPYREPGVRHWDVLWDRRPDRDGAPTWHKYLTGCRSLAEAKLFVALFVHHLAAREWMPVRNGIDPRQLAEAARARSGSASRQRTN